MVALGHIYNEDCRATMQRMEADSVDTIITDPPYGLEFMGKGWDKGVPGMEFWVSALRIAKPGATLLAFGGTRTYHRLACAIEDAGWEIRDCLMWLYGSGFPKSMDIGKALDKRAGAKGEVIGTKQIDLGIRSGSLHAGRSSQKVEVEIHAPASDLSKQWSGWGTALKPAWEPVIVAMKPCCGTFAENAEKHGVAGFNIEGSRIAHNEPCKMLAAQTNRDIMSGDGKLQQGGRHHDKLELKPSGRWPANVLHDGSEEVLRGFPESKTRRCEKPSDCTEDGQWGTIQGRRGARGYDGDGSAARFFFCGKASQGEREFGLLGYLPCLVCGGVESVTHKNEKGEDVPCRRNGHPTVKPVSIMEYLCTLTKTPTGGIVYDPFAGSGSTLVACARTGRPFVGSEIDKHYTEVSTRRVAAAEEAKRKMAKNQEPTLWDSVDDEP